MKHQPDYCPLCGAHPVEQGEGGCPDKLKWKQEIEELYQELKDIEKVKDDGTTRS